MCRVCGARRRRGRSIPQGIFLSVDTTTPSGAPRTHPHGFSAHSGHGQCLPPRHSILAEVAPGAFFGCSKRRPLRPTPRVPSSGPDCPSCKSTSCTLRLAVPVPGLACGCRWGVKVAYVATTPFHLLLCFGKSNGSVRLRLCREKRR